MRKIIITNKEDKKALYDAFSSTNNATVRKALSFQSKSLLASRIRCYAMNFLASAELLTTK